MDEVPRPSDLDVDPVPVAKRLGRIGVIITIGGLDQGRVGEVLIEDRVLIEVSRKSMVPRGRGTALAGKIVRLERSAQGDDRWGRRAMGKRLCRTIAYELAAEACPAGAKLL
jgi:hypothetical protein